MNEKNAEKINISRIADDVYFLDLSYTTNCYLVTGSKRALLIDCGTGFCDVKGAVKSITSLPVDLVLTHGHTDHFGGMRQFDKAYIHGDDWKRINKLMATRFASRLFLMMDTNARKHGFNQKDLIKERKMPEIVFVDDGYIFDLGGKTVTVKHTPGHSAGSIALIDNEDKIIFSGDNVCDALWMMLPGAVSIDKWIPGAQWLYDMSITYKVYWAHRKAELTSEYIGTVLGWGRDLLEIRRKNAKFSTVRQYPKQPDGIIYRTGNVFGK
jgi:hydroxyacylglutathione hydrolase